MLLHNRQRKLKENEKVQIKINDTVIKSVTSFDLLGITLDEHLTWNAHLNKLSNKISKINGILARLKRQLPLHTLRLIYNSLILSGINYGIIIWGQNRKRLIKIQKSL